MAYDVQSATPDGLVTLGRRVAPILARLSSRPRALAIARMAEIYLQILQGRGAGTGWDVAAEATVARRVLSGCAEPVIFDVGANLGQWASAAHSELRNANARFFLVEPQACCQPDLAALDVPNKTIIRAAVSDRAGSGQISGAEPGHGAASLYERHDTYFGDMAAHKERVEVTTIDQVMAKQRVDRVDFLKLDIEGAELAALRGASEALKARRISAIAFEFGSANIYSRTFFRDFWDMLASHGLVLRRIRPGGGLLPIPRYSEELEHYRGVSNYLALLAPRLVPDLGL